MERIRGAQAEGSGGPSGPAVAASGPARPAAEDSPAACDEEPDVALPAAPARRKPVQLAPRTAAPETAIGLTAMRELANLSAQAALDKHTHGKMRGLRRRKLFLCVGGLLCGGLLLWLSIARGANLAFYAAMVGFLGSLLWAVQYALLTGRMVLDRRGHLAWKSQARPAAKPGDEEPASVAPAAVLAEGTAAADDPASSVHSD